MFAVATTPASAPLMAGASFQDRSDGTSESAAAAAVERSKSQWRKLLAPESYAVLFEARTEPPFTSPLDKESRPGVYVCAA